MFRISLMFKPGGHATWIFFWCVLACIVTKITEWIQKDVQIRAKSAIIGYKPTYHTGKEKKKVGEKNGSVCPPYQADFSKEAFFTRKTFHVATLSQPYTTLDKNYATVTTSVAAGVTVGEYRKPVSFVSICHCLSRVIKIP